ncbi:MAG: hypothetical protein ABJC13_01400 [Acidobacteriota bacterium]
MSTFRSRASVLPLAAALIALLSAAAPAAAVPIPWDFGGWLRGVLSSLWAESGCGFDPNGRCGAAPAPVEGGCGFDPNGRCGTAPAPVDSGCAFDPDGRCKP